MKQAALIVIGAILGASLMTVFFLPLCLKAIGSGYCMPLTGLFIPLLTHLGSEGGAAGVFQAIWLGYFAWLLVLLTGAIWVRRKFLN